VKTIIRANLTHRAQRSFTPHLVKPRYLWWGWNGAVKTSSPKSPLFIRGAGFTLIEVIVVIIIIVVMTVISLASFSQLAPKRLSAEARKMVSDLAWVRQMAVATHNDYIIHFDTSAERYKVYRGSVSPANEVKNVLLGVDLYSVSPGTDLRFCTFSDSNPQAGKADNDFTITLKREGKQKIISVYQGTGYIKVQ